MELTKEKLQKLIKEELQNFKLNEGANKRLRQLDELYSILGDWQQVAEELAKAMSDREMGENYEYIKRMRS